MRLWTLQSCALFLSTVAVAQNDRAMRLSAPVVVGQTAAFSLRHPVAAAGNGYLFLLTAPQYPVVQPIAIPGFTVRGLVRIDPLNFQDLFAGVLGATGTATQTIAVPNDPLFVGITFDLQSVDFEAATSTLTLADNELALHIAAAPGPDMVPIAPGTFSMGSQTYFDQGFVNEGPVHAVTLTRPFWMGRHEVTQTEYQALMGTNPSTWIGPNDPVGDVTWFEAVAYCAALSAQEAAAGRLPSGYTYRLPTDAEWEYCCRAGTVTEFHTGDALSCAEANAAACLWPNASRTVPVGSYPANAWGLHDMHGNASEWVLDSYFGPGYAPGAATDPYQPNGASRVVRSGWYDIGTVACRSAARGAGLPTTRLLYIGFRVVLAPTLGS